VLFRYILIGIVFGITACAPNTSLINDDKKIPIFEDFKNISILDDIKNISFWDSLKNDSEKTKAEVKETAEQDPIEKSKKAAKKPNYTSVDPRLAKILSSPSLLANKESIAAAKKGISVVKSQREPLVTGTSNIGPRLSDTDTVDFEATGGVSVTKVIRDGGALDALTEAAELSVESAQLLYTQNANRQIAEVLKAESGIVNFRKIKAIYDEQTNIYLESLPLIETALKANVISKTDALKLQQLKIKSDERYLAAKTAADSAQLVRDKYGLSEKDTFFDLNTVGWKSFKSDKLTVGLENYRLLDIQIALLEKDIAGVEASFDPKVSLAGSATANVTNIDNSIGFLGLNITLPLRDGGKRKFEIEEKNIQIASIEQQKDELLRVNSTAFLTLENFETIYDSRMALLDAQIENSEVIASDMELKLRAGAVSVADLATEKMTYFDLKTQKITLEYQRFNEILNYHQALGYECNLINLCDQIKSVAEME